jgi:hypothetical protein
VALAVATALLTVIGAAFALAGSLLLVLATGRIPFLDSLNAFGAVVLVGVGAIALAWFAWLAAGSLWRGRARGWTASLVIAVVAVGAALTAAVNSGGQGLVVVGLVLTACALGFVLAPSTRHAAGVA